MGSSFNDMLDRIEAELSELDVKALLFYSLSASALAIALGLWFAVFVMPDELLTRADAEASKSMLERGMAGFVFFATFAAAVGMGLLYRYRRKLGEGEAGAAVPTAPEAGGEAAASGGDVATQETDGEAPAV